MLQAMGLQSWTQLSLNSQGCTLGKGVSQGLEGSCLEGG